MTSTRQQFVETMSALLAVQGYHGTGLNQVVRESGAPKGSLYYHFPGGKEELTAQAIARIGTQVAERIERAMAAEADPVDGLRSFVLDVAHDVRQACYRGGAPVAAVALEAAGQSEKLTKACDAAYHLWERRFRERLQAAGLGAETSRRLAMAIVAFVEGSVVLARARQDAEPLELLADLLPRLVPREEEVASEALRAAEVGAAAGQVGPTETPSVAEPDAGYHVLPRPAYGAPRAGGGPGESPLGADVTRPDGAVEAEHAWSPARPPALQEASLDDVASEQVAVEEGAAEPHEEPTAAPDARVKEPAPTGGEEAQEAAREAPDDVPAALFYSRSGEETGDARPAHAVAEEAPPPVERPREPEVPEVREPTALVPETGSLAEEEAGAAHVDVEEELPAVEVAEGPAPSAPARDRTARAYEPPAPIAGRERRRHPRRLAIFGASGRVGSRLLEQALASGYVVTAFVRNANRIWVKHERLRVVEGNVRDPEPVSEAIKGADAVLCALGAGQDDRGNELTVGTQNIVGAMRAHRVPRLIALTGTAVTSTRDEPSTARSVMLGLKRMFAGSAVRDAEGMVQVIRSSELEWTIVRAPRLTNRRRTGDYHVGYLPLGPRSRVSRADLAAFMLSQLADDAYLCQMPMISQ